MNLPSLEGHGAISVDVETKDPMIKVRGSGAHVPEETFVAGVAVATEAGFREYFPVRHEEGGNVDPAPVFGWLREELRREDQPKIGANLLYDVGFLAQEDVEMRGPLWDVQIAEPLLDENAFTYNLDRISMHHLGEGKVDEEMDAYLVARYGDKKNPKQHIWRAHASKVRDYAIGDVDRPLRIFAKQRPELERQDLWELFEMESKLIPLLAKMRRRGVRVDVSKAEKMRDECVRKREGLVEEIKRLTGIQIASSGMGSEIVRVLQQIGITEFPLTPKTKKPSITAPYVESIGHPTTEMIVEVRKLDKLVGTFLEGCILRQHHRGRVHCQFNQMKGEDGGTVTGRFSSSKPNLQFIPVRTELGKMIRSIFQPDEGHVWYKLDYSQIEYVLMIHDAVTLNLRGAREVAQNYTDDEDADFHQLVADMTGLSRSRAKTINFGLAYGEGVEKLCRQLGLSRDEGEALIREYHRGAPFMKPLINGCMEAAKRNGEIRTLMKRKRRFPYWEIWDRKNKKKVVVPHRIAGAERAFCHKALNARTQGSAADVMKAAMVDLIDSGVVDTLGAPQLTVHDELDGSMPDTREGREAIQEMKRVMENCVQLSVPLRVDPETGPNWGECSKIVPSEEIVASAGRGGGFT